MEAGTKLGRYETKQIIGKGGMGEVYLAHDRNLDRDVAIKVLLPEFCCNLERVNRFKLEARVVSALNHPNIITIHEIGEHDEQIYIATEYIKGETLRSLLERKAITFGSALHIAEQITNGLTAAHTAGIIHRDLKPENIMLRADGARLSPDGKNLLFINAPINFETGVMPQSALYLAPFDGKTLGTAKQVVKNLNSNQYKWSPDGKSILFTDLSGGNTDIWRLNPNDGKTSKITNFNLESIVRYAVSPNGKKNYLVRRSTTQDIILIKAGTN